MKKPKVDEKTGQIEMPLVPKTVEEERDSIAREYGILKEYLVLEKGIWYVRRGEKLFEPAEYVRVRNKQLEEEKEHKKNEEARLHARPNEYKKPEPEESKAKSEFQPSPAGATQKGLEDYLTQ